MNFLKTNYPLKKEEDAQEKTESSIARKEPVNHIDFEKAMLEHIGGSFVYIKPRKFIVIDDES